MSPRPTHHLISDHPPRSRHIALVLAMLALLLALSTQSAAAQERLALLIGNGAYASGALANPVNDATDMAERLRGYGFGVTLLTDADQRTMEQAIRRFTRDLSGEGKVGLFYFAGHGVEHDGHNFLVPIGADIQGEVDLRYEAVDAGRVLDGMAAAGNGLNLVMLDACRNNPYRSAFRSAGRGLARMDPAKGNLILYATQPGSVAGDGSGRNGVFTKHLLEAMAQPGLEVEQVFKRAALAVDQETGGAQTPWVEGVVLGRFSFTAAAETPQTPRTPPRQAATGEDFDRQLELSVWNSIKGQCNREMYIVYLDKYPNGLFAPIARLRLQELGRWKDVKRGDRASDYEDYLAAFPEGCYAEPAKERLDAARARLEQPARPSAPLIPRPSTPPIPLPEASHYFHVVNVADDDVLNMRRTAGARASIVGTIPPNGRCIAYLGEERSLSTNTWIKVRYGDSSGWVNSHYLTAQSGDAYRVVNVASWDVLNMRAGPDTSNPKVGAIPPGAVCHADAAGWTGHRRWIYVGYDGRRGWVSSEFLRDADDCR